MVFVGHAYAMLDTPADSASRKQALAKRSAAACCAGTAQRHVTVQSHSSAEHAHAQDRFDSYAALRAHRCAYMWGRRRTSFNRSTAAAYRTGSPVERSKAGRDSGEAVVSAEQRVLGRAEAGVAEQQSRARCAPEYRQAVGRFVFRGRRRQSCRVARYVHGKYSDVPQRAVAAPEGQALYPPAAPADRDSAASANAAWR